MENTLEGKKFNRNTIIIIIALLFMFLTKYGPIWGTLSREGAVTLGIMLVMALFWVLEPVPIYATALIPLVFFPLFKVDTFASIATNYSNSNIYLFFGGFILALSMEGTGLHKRIALGILKAVGTKPANIVLGFILAPGLLSMWISNTATAVLMMPIAISILSLLEDTVEKSLYKSLTIAILLSIAFASSIGGMATIIGTPPNAILSAFAKDKGINIEFGKFIIVGLPIALGGFVIMWLLFTKVLFKFGKEPIHSIQEIIDSELKKISQMSTAEKRVMIVFIITALLWITRQLIAKVLEPLQITISDPGIAMLSAITLFLLSDGNNKRIMTWQQTKNLPWGILLLFGGGLALGQQVQKTGVGLWMVGGLQDALTQIPLILIIVMVTLFATMLSQFSSNTSVTAAFLPIFYSLAEVINVHPLFIMMPLTFGASAVFMLPSATPPNAIIMSGKGIEVKHMVKYGGILNLCFIVFVIAVVYIILQFNLAFDTGDGTFESVLNTVGK